VADDLFAFRLLREIATRDDFAFFVAQNDEAVEKSFAIFHGDGLWRQVLGLSGR
jgi:hypothetical protein